MDSIRLLTNCKLCSRAEYDKDKEAWLKARTKGIGGSDIGPICGVSPFSSARQIYLSKTGQYDEGTDKHSSAALERMHFGHILEPVVADEYARRTGHKVISLNATLAHKDYPWAMANIDRLIVDEEGRPTGILECKTTGEYLRDEWENGQVPITYLYQINWYLWILDLQVADLACLVGGNKFFIYPIYRDDELISNVMIPRARDFWFNNVLELKEPELQVTDTDLINNKYAGVEKNSEVFLDDDISNELASTIVEYKRKIKEMDKQVKEAQNRIKDRLKDKEIGYTKDYVIKWSLRKQVRVDTEKLKTDFPETYTQVQKAIQYRVMTIKECIQ